MARDASAETRRQKTESTGPRAKASGKRQTRAEKAAEATAEFDTFIVKSVDDFEKAQAQKAKDANNAEWDKKNRAHTEAEWQAAEEQKALGVLNRGNRGFNFVEIDDAKDYVDRGEDALVDLKAASRGDSEALKKLANNTGITVVSSSELTPTHPAFLSRSGFGSGEDGNPVVTESSSPLPRTETVTQRRWPNPLQTQWKRPGRITSTRI